MLQPLSVLSSVSQEIRHLCISIIIYDPAGLTCGGGVYYLTRLTSVLPWMHRSQYLIRVVFFACFHVFSCKDVQSIAKMKYCTKAGSILNLSSSFDTHTHTHACDLQALWLLPFQNLYEKPDMHDFDIKCAQHLHTTSARDMHILKRTNDFEIKSAQTYED